MSISHSSPSCPEDPFDILGSSLSVPSDTGLHAVQRIPWTSRDPPLGSHQTQAPMLSGGSRGHPRILPLCPRSHRLPCGPEDPVDIPGSSLCVPSHTGSHVVQRIPWTSQDPPLVSPPPTHRAPCCPEDTVDIPGSSLCVLPHTGPHTVRRIPWTSQDPPLLSPLTQAPMLSGGFFGHPGILPLCPLQTQAPKLSGGSQDTSLPITSVQGMWTTWTCGISLCGCEGVRLPLYIIVRLMVNV